MFVVMLVVSYLSMLEYCEVVDLVCQVECFLVDVVYQVVWDKLVVVVNLGEWQWLLVCFGLLVDDILIQGINLVMIDFGDVLGVM